MSSTADEMDTAWLDTIEKMDDDMGEILVKHSGLPDIMSSEHKADDTPDICSSTTALAGDSWEESSAVEKMESDVMETESTMAARCPVEASDLPKLENENVDIGEITQEAKITPDALGCALNPDCVNIQTIDIGEDDLFDFLENKPLQLSDSESEEKEQELTEEQIKGRELYRYLTVSDPTKLRSLEVTPAPSLVATPVASLVTTPVTSLVTTPVTSEDEFESSEASSTEHMNDTDEEVEDRSEVGDEASVETPRKRRSFTPEKKQEILRYALSMGSHKASKLYRLSRSTITKWFSESEMCPKGGFKIGRPLSYPAELEKSIRAYIVEKLIAGDYMTKEDVRMYSRSVIQESFPDFKASRPWLFGFLRRHGLWCDGRYVRLKTGEEEEKEMRDYSGGDSDSGEEHTEVDPVKWKTGTKRRKKPDTDEGVLSSRTVEKLEKSKEVTEKWLKDLELPKELCIDKPVMFKIGELNQYLTCGLCRGYLYEASTITECMHTFCKNCIVRHCMEVSLHCPVCSILIHPTDPFVHIRLDRMIQDIVYKILPSVADTEIRNIEKFYEAHPEVEPKDIQDPPPKPRVSPRDKDVPHPQCEPALISLVLEADGPEAAHVDKLEKKFVRVVGTATVDNVCHFLRKKLNLHEQKQVELYCCGDSMSRETCTLQDIHDRFYTDQENLILLQYRISDFD
ncbi:uncharacterized protein LOC127856863 isoform X2 [Dreissena polymorpha]|nr:uncharacterized protein LOC127856863 isoform X2 [Dreissena polymorpha]